MRIVLVLTLFLLCTACGDVKDLRFAGDNEEQVLEKLNKGRGLTGEEVLLLDKALKRIAAEEGSIEGKSVATLLYEQAQLNNGTNPVRLEFRNMILEKRKKDATLAAELSKYITAAPFRKDFQRISPRSNEYEIAIAHIFENKSDKFIRAFKGRIIYKDLFGEKIKTIFFTYNDGLAARSRIDWTGTVKYDRFDSGLNKLKDTSLENMRMEWQPTAIIFSDNSTMGLVDK